MVPVTKPVTPPVYTPPPEPSLKVNLPRCTLCMALMTYGSESRHREWHMVNGLHGAYCDLMVSMAQRPSGDDGPLRACTCGLIDNDKKES